MIDYRAHVAVLEQLHQALSTLQPTTPSEASLRAQTLSALVQAQGYAQLGALIDHLFMHTSSNGTEMLLVEEAAKLWQEGIDLYNDFSDIRAKLEDALSHPDEPNSVVKFNQAMETTVSGLATIKNKQDQMSALGNKLATLPHLMSHPRQQDSDLKHWDWGNLFLSRRTDAFVRKIAEDADNPQTRAFAFGVLASYGGNAAGSAYLGHVVGGPRRAHRFRDRLARNSMGSWFAVQQPSLKSFGSLATKINLNANNSLPHELETLLTNALQATFDVSQTAPVPDLNLGYQRLLRHLELLDVFSLPAMPAMPPDHFTSVIYGDPTNPEGPSYQTQGIGGDGNSGLGDGPNSSSSVSINSTDSQNSDSGKACGTCILALIALGIVITMIIIEANDDDDDDDVNVNAAIGAGAEIPWDETNSAKLQDLASSESAYKMVNDAFEAHCKYWEVLNQAYNYLAITGLIYPDGLIDLPRFEQFTKTPTMTNWPHRPETKPLDKYHLYPLSATEQPSVSASYFAVGSQPDIFLPEAVRIAKSLWVEIAGSLPGSKNLDLDADRGLHHLAWKSGNSINDNPLNVVLLGYNEQ